MRDGESAKLKRERAALSSTIRHYMTVSATSLGAIVEGELATVRDNRVVTHVRSLLVPPAVEMRAWDYAATKTTYPCWIVLAHPPSNTGIAYCEFGFGPRSPWGLRFLEGTEHMSMGMDSGWYGLFLDAYFESKAATELPIWRVFQDLGQGSPRVAITPHDTWDAAWAIVMRLRAEQPKSRFDCSHDISP
jgi:hypothetical protein